jgi:subtilase family serine protease
MGRRGTAWVSVSMGLVAAMLFAAGAQAKPERSVCPGPARAGSVRCFAHVVTDSKGTPATTILPAGYGPAQFHGAYSLPLTIQGSTPQTIAIVDAYDDRNIRSDLTTYDSTFGIPDLPTCARPSSGGACFAKVNQSGVASSYPSSNSGWDLEIALDVETAHQTCQNCKIVLVEASSSSDANLDTAEDTAYRLGATEISNSWGTSSEYAGEVAENSAHFNHPGVAITVASGDSGYNAFGFPAASPGVIDAGGTMLSVTQSNGGYSWGGESSWSGSGSGCSVYFSAQNWQTSALSWTLTGCSSRSVADVAADADPNTGAAVYDSVKYDGRSGWFQVGGTSLASPLIAAVYALADNAATAQAYPVGTTSLYPAELPYDHPAALHDITTGPGTGNCGTTACNAGVGYDGPTGVGTPNGLAAF